MDFISSLGKGGDSKTDKPAAGAEAKSSTSDILADAKVVAEVARAPEKCDKAKAAASAADLLDAAADYGKLDESKGAGKYVEQAESYLRQYSGPKPAAGEDKPAPTTATNAAAAVAEAEIPSGGAPADHVKEPEKPAESGGGYGDLMKAAGGFLNK